MKLVDRVYGEIEITDPAALAIIQAPAFDRLWRIKQNGPVGIANPSWVTSRAEHCIGVYHLLRMFGASREEQLAGLVHDVNHVAFSHLVDWLIGDEANQEGHADFISVNPHLAAIKQIIIDQGLDGEAIMDYSRYPLLEQPAPDLCADRIDYTFRDGLCSEQTSPNEITRFVENLSSENGQFVMKDLDIAEDFARLSIDIHIIREGNWGNALYKTIVRLLKRAMRDGLLTREDFLFDDDRVYAIMKAVKGPEAELFFAWEQAGAPIEQGTPDDFHLQVWSKIRYIDPLVPTPQGLKRVSELRPGFAEILKHYRLLRGNASQVKYPAAFTGLTAL